MRTPDGFSFTVKPGFAGLKKELKVTAEEKDFSNVDLGAEETGSDDEDEAGKDPLFRIGAKRVFECVEGYLIVASLVTQTADYVRIS